MKGVAVYGAFEVLEPVWQRYWHVRKDGVRQRYWHKTSRMKKVIRTDARYEFTGQGKSLYRAVVESRRRVPFDYIEVGADEFLEHPEKYGSPGRWVEWKVDS